MIFNLYVLFIMSFFLHLPARIPLLGTLRFDMLLFGLISILLVFRGGASPVAGMKSETSRILLILILYIMGTVFLVQWPGTVIWVGIPLLIKAMAFYFFTIALVTDERRLRILIAVFLICQTFRVIEPLYLHVVTGYWGSATTMGTNEFMDRLAGAPADIINPNGLAFVIVSIIPLYHYLSAVSFRYKVLYCGLMPAFLYALILTASRSGFLALSIIAFNIFLNSKRKLVFAGVIALSALILLGSLNDIQRDRYLSIYRDDVRGSQTAQGRTEGIVADFAVGMRNPIVGHGLGSSPEAMYHATGNWQRSHTLYSEIFQELGGIGLIIFLLFIKSIVANYRKVLKRFHEKKMNNIYLLHINQAMLVWLWMNILFSFASYGLTSYEWYFFGGLSVVMNNLIAEESRSNNSPMKSGLQ